MAEGEVRPAHRRARRRGGQVHRLGVHRTRTLANPQPPQLVPFLPLPPIHSHGRRPVCMQVNKTINMLCSWHAQGKDSKEFQRHVDRVPDYLWLAEDGMKMQVPLSFSP